MSKKRNRKDDQPEVVTAAAGLVEALESLEASTRRVTKAELGSRKDLLRAGEVLQKAAEGHSQFLAHLEALSAAVDELRRRQNASANVLTHRAHEIDERRQAYEGLERRFAELGKSAGEITVAMADVAAAAEGREDAPDSATVAARLDEAEARLTQTVDEAKALAADGREAGFVELETQARSLSQQLGSLIHKLDKIRGAVL